MLGLGNVPPPPLIYVSNMFDGVKRDATDRVGCNHEEGPAECIGYAEFSHGVALITLMGLELLHLYPTGLFAKQYEAHTNGAHKSPTPFLIKITARPI